MAKIVFYKMHGGLGNDFMVVDGVNQAMPLSAEQVTNLGNRHMGVGFDQLLVIAPPETKRPTLTLSFLTKMARWLSNAAMGRAVSPDLSSKKA